MTKRKHRITFDFVLAEILEKLEKGNINSSSMHHPNNVRHTSCNDTTGSVLADVDVPESVDCQNLEFLNDDQVNTIFTYLFIYRK